MKLFERFIPSKKKSCEENSNSGENVLTNSDIFDIFVKDDYNGEAYRFNAWVNICVGIVTRNVARAGFLVKSAGNEVKSGAVYELFRRPNEGLSRFDLWKETAAWWLLEGEAFWYFGPEYAGGLPKKIYILDPRRIRNDYDDNELDQSFCRSKNRRWFYQSGVELIPILNDEIIHFRDWNPWNPVRGVNPLVSLALELEQDYFANRANSNLLKNNAIPQGILKTEQSIRPEEADALERRWESKYGKMSGNRKIAVLGKGTTFEALSFSPEVVKLFELKRWNLYTILSKYGIPPRVANVNDKTASLSGKDTSEQHAAFWKYTLIPLLKQFESILESQFFCRFGLTETGVFDLRDIPELQKAEDEQSIRDIAEINAGLKTINDVLIERGKEPKPWGDMWYRPSNVVPVETTSVTTEE